MVVIEGDISLTVHRRSSLSTILLPETKKDQGKKKPAGIYLLKQHKKAGYGKQHNVHQKKKLMKNDRGQ